MAKNVQQQELHKTIWNTADSLRGAVDGWAFKAYILGSLFYRFISENLTQRINELQWEAGMKGFDYAKISDEEAEEARQLMVEEKGFFILPSQLFCNVARRPEANPDLNEDINRIFRAIEGSSCGTASEPKMKNLFADFLVDNSLLGGSVAQRNKRLSDVLTAVRKMDLGGDFAHHDIDAFGDAYEYLMKMYASKAGKGGGEYFTPQEVSEVLARIVLYDNHVGTVYDPCCGSGSLLLRVARMMEVEGQRARLKYYGQELNPTTYNLCRINMFLHNVNYDNFDIQQEDTLLNPQHLGMKFDAVVSNPPYSAEWIGKDNPLLMNDARFSPAGVLAPKSAADLDFVMHILYHLKESGTAAIVEFPGVLYRSGAEKKIRQYLVSNNYVDTIIQLPENLFFGVTIATCIIVLKKGKKRDSNILFIDASQEFVKQGNKNVLTKENRDKIVEAYQKREEVQYFTKLVEISEVLKHESNLTVSSYVEKEEKREVIDIQAVNKEVREIRARGDELAAEIEKIIKEMEG